MNPLVLVIDDEPDVEVLFRQQFRRDLRADRFTMEFADVLFARFPSHHKEDNTNKLLSAMRQAFGAHVEPI